MTSKRTLFRALTAVLAVTVFVLGAPSAWAQRTQFLRDGAIPNANGGWDLPAQGTCPSDPTKLTRPDCIAQRLDIVQASCVSPNYSWTTGGVCNDTVNNTQALCEAQPDRLWNAGTNVCAIVMKGDDRNNVVCALHNGTWSTTATCIGVWVMPPPEAYTPQLATGITGVAAGTGDQCLRCHNAKTQYNGPRIRDTENTLYTGHKNMARKVVPGMPWGGPPFTCTNATFTDEQTCEDNGFDWFPTIYPSDDAGNVFDWDNGKVNAAGGPYDLTWIYGDWLAPLPRAIYKKTGGITYSCGRCHTTGWTSDSILQADKEPELSFPGITWSGSGSADNKVKLGGGVAGDPNVMSSWDEWGISCTRCHSSAVDTDRATCKDLAGGQTTCTSLGGSWASATSTCAPLTQAQCTGNGGNVVGLLSPVGMSTHHNDLTAANVGGTGYCTDPRFTQQAQCDAAGGAWLTACSIPGVCSNPAYTTSGSCLLNGGSWTAYTSSGACTGGGGTWNTATSCSVAGVCNDPAMTTQVACTGTVDSGPLTGLVRQWAAASDIVRCEDVGGKWTGSKTNRGQIITNLCMNCHRQENVGLPYTNGTCSNPLYTDQGNCVKNAGAWTDSGNGVPVKVGAYHSTVTYPSHPHGNQFLNSVHAKFTGSYAQIPTAKWPAQYKSYFMNDGEAANTGNGCTGCHDVHESVVEHTSPFPPIKEECTECHAGPYNRSLTAIQHPSGVGTPLEEMDTKPWEACISCHMPGDAHLWRINTSPVYSTFPAAARTASAAPFVNANTSPEGTFTNAVWVDMDQACGQCHGGGTNSATTTATGNTGAVINVASTTGFAVGERIKIADAGAYEYDELNLVPGDFESYIVSIAPGSITVVGAPPLSAAGKAVTQNPTKNGASYKTKPQLANLARTMHPESGRDPATPSVNFAYTTSGLTVNVNGSGSTCSGACDTYTWNWGDGTPDGSGATASHTYATGGAKTIKLSAEQSGVSGGTSTKNVNVYVPDTPPDVTATTCVFDANTWTATVTDGATDDKGVKQVTVNWGDGTSANDLSAPFGPFSRTYLAAVTRTITYKAIDTIGQQSTKTCSATPAFFSIGGTVYLANGTTTVAAATVKVMNGATLVKTVTTASNGTFTAASLKPGTYTLVVTKTGLTFPAVAPIVVGPSSSGNNILAN